MKKFETPVIEIEKLNIADVIATSVCGSDGCNGYTPCTVDACEDD